MYRINVIAPIGLTPFGVSFCRNHDYGKIITVGAALAHSAGKLKGSKPMPSAASYSFIVP